MTRSQTELLSLSEVRLAAQTLSSDKDSNTASVDKLLGQIDVATGICESAALGANSTDLKNSLREAKKWYAEALRCAGRLSFSVQDVDAFEVRTMRLEEAISQLESRWVSSSSDSAIHPR